MRLYSAASTDTPDTLSGLSLNKTLMDKETPAQMQTFQELILALQNFWPSAAVSLPSHTTWKWVLALFTRRLFYALLGRNPGAQRMYSRADGQPTVATGIIHFDCSITTSSGGD